MHIVFATALGDYRLHLRFEDGVEGVVDLAPHLSFQGVFAPLRDLAYFAQVRADAELGTVAWPNGADLDPDVLYGRITGTPILQERDAQLAHQRPAPLPACGGWHSSDSSREERP
jgi:hypothetical protein